MKALQKEQWPKEPMEDPRHYYDYEVEEVELVGHEITTEKENLAHSNEHHLSH
jgi:hypothetical protein